MAALVSTDMSAPSAPSAHTPGPWSYCGVERGGCSCMTVMSANHPVATITSGDWGDEYPSLRLTGGSLDRGAEAYMEKTVYGEVHEDVAKANARLIAAAPDLLFALKNLLAVRRGEGGTAYHCDEIAEAAIAKALGQRSASREDGLRAPSSTPDVSDEVPGSTT